MCKSYWPYCHGTLELDTICLSAALYLWTSGKLILPFSPAQNSCKDLDSWHPRCGIGLQRRDRACDSPLPSKDGYPCFGDSAAYEICSEFQCNSKYSYCCSWTNTLINTTHNKINAFVIWFLYYTRWYLWIILC